MRGLRRPPPPPAEPPASNSAASAPRNSRGKRDAPEGSPHINNRRGVFKSNNNVPDLLDDQYSSDESDSGSPADRGGRLQREPSFNSGMEWVNSRHIAPSLDPPDELLLAHNDNHNRGRDTNPHVMRGESPSASRSNSRSRNRQSKRPSAKLLEDEEELYEQYQDELFHQQPLYTQHQYPQQQQHQQPVSSYYGQFNIAPALVEMTPLSTKKKKKKQHRSSSIKQSKNKGRYSQLDQEEEDDDVEKSIDRVLDSIPGTNPQQQQRKTHEEFYNLSSDKSDDSDSDDEERPLTQNSSSRTHHSSFLTNHTATSFREKCLNRLLLALISLLSLLFLRDHTPWYKSYQERLAIQKYNSNHQEDPMKVYNSGDDDSMNARDHDPTGDSLSKVKKLDKLYFGKSAGERISGRPAEKSLHHGFMDENYENRPPAKNSGLATAQSAGVKGGNKKRDKETEAFLASVKKKEQHPSSIMGGASSSVVEDSKGKAVYVKTKPKSVVPPPPPPSRPVETVGSLYESTGSGFNLEGYEYNNARVKESSMTSASEAAATTTAAGNFESGGYQYSNQNEEFESATKTDVSSSTFDESYKKSESALNMNDYLYDSKSKTEEDSSYSFSYNDSYGGTSSEFENEFTAGIKSHTGSSYVQSSYSEIDDPEKPISLSSMYSSSKHTSPEKPPSSASSSFSSFDQSMTTQDVKTMYKDTFYRWNHPFRHDQTEEMNGGADIPVFWRVPRSASGVVEATMSYCYGLTLASALGAGFQDGTLHTIKVPAGAQFVNVDVSTPKGIEEAAALGLANSGLADIISSPFIYETTTLFQDTPAAGKCFTLLRHPVERAISQYHFYQKEESVTHNNKQYQGMTIDEFAEAVAENNWMVRFLTGKRSGTLSWHDLEAAKEVFGRKCLVGLSDKAEESIRRYERFFRWGKGVANEKQKESCLQTTLSKHDKRKDHPTFTGSDAWEVLRKKNEYDVLLYEYARNLYSQQSVLYENYG